MHGRLFRFYTLNSLVRFSVPRVAFCPHCDRRMRRISRVIGGELPNYECLRCDVSFDVVPPAHKRARAK